ncbi:MAG: molybdopterin molybdotransferase MoeA [Clostridia bacterium]|nr:molybdopterin molybdotransferase MoeA [Clostridia bacterium]
MLKNADWLEARALLLSRAVPVEAEEVPLADCGGRVLAFDLRAAEDVPAFDRSAYDGYALRAADIADASRERPVTLKITETIAAGQVGRHPVTSGTAAHLMTGAAIPEGADCVINFERTEYTADTVTLFAPLRMGDNIVRRGEDVAAGALLAARGTVIDAGLAGTLAAQGVAQVLVYRQPVIGLISTGSEVVEAEAAPGPGQIRNANRAAFTALMNRQGFQTKYLGLAGDEAADIAGLIAQGLASCDAVLLTGGVSVGDWDVTPEAMERCGVEILLRGVAMKPGMACAYGIREHCLVLGLSGNPASSLTNFCACALPALRKLAGRSDAEPPMISLTLMYSFKKKSPATRFLRGRLDLSDGTARLDAPGDQGNVVLSSAIGCNAFAVVPAGSGPLSAGDKLKGFII